MIDIDYSRFCVNNLPINGRGLSIYDNVCVHEDGYEAKVKVPDEYCHWGKGTLHLYVAQKNQFRHPEIVAAYIAHIFNCGNTKTNTDKFFDGTLDIRIPDIWIIDGKEVKEEGCVVTCSRSDQHRARYKKRGDSPSMAPRVSLVDINCEAKLKLLIKQRVEMRLYKKDFDFVSNAVFNAIMKTYGLEHDRGTYDRAISKLLESKILSPYVDKPTRDKIRQNYRSSDHVRNRTTNLAKMISEGRGYGGIRG